MLHLVWPLENSRELKHFFSTLKQLNPYASFHMSVSFINWKNQKYWQDVADDSVCIHPTEWVWRGGEERGSLKSCDNFSPPGRKWRRAVHDAVSLPRQVSLCNPRPSVLISYFKLLNAAPSCQPHIGTAQPPGSRNCPYTDRPQWPKWGIFLLFDSKRNTQNSEVEFRIQGKICSSETTTNNYPQRPYSIFW